MRPALINARFAKPLDTELIDRCMAGKKLVVKATVKPYLVDVREGDRVDVLGEILRDGDRCVGELGQLLHRGSERNVFELHRHAGGKLARDRLLPLRNDAGRTRATAQKQVQERLHVGVHRVGLVDDE